MFAGGKKFEQKTIFQRNPNILSDPSEGLRMEHNAVTVLCL